MFSIEFLHTIREYESNTISKHFAPGVRILEIGGGTGYQAKLLADRGFDVTAIDVGRSLRSRSRLARVLGSATMLYVVQPIAEASLPERRVCRGH